MGTIAPDLLMPSRITVTQILTAVGYVETGDHSCKLMQCPSASLHTIDMLNYWFHDYWFYCVFDPHDKPGVFLVKIPFNRLCHASEFAALEVWCTVEMYVSYI